MESRVSSVMNSKNSRESSFHMTRVGGMKILREGSERGALKICVLQTNRRGGGGS